jgi:phage minor structural protein
LQVYVLDRSKNTLATTSQIYDDIHHKELTAGASTYNFTVDKSDPAAQYMVSGNYIVFKDDQGKPWSFSILYYDETQQSKKIYTEDVGIELINKAMDVWYFEEPHDFKYYFDLVTDGTPWELNVNQLEGLSRTLNYTGRDTGLGRLLSILKGFDNAECEFVIDMKGTVPVKYVVNVYKQVGYHQDNIQIVYNRELNDITKTESRQDFVTALAGVGSVIQDTSDTSTGDASKPQKHVSFKDLEYNGGDYVSKAGDPFIRAVTANKQFNPGDQGYVENFYDYDTSDVQELFNRTLSQLIDRSKPAETYVADVKVIDPTLDIGDTVKIIDHDYNPALYLEARVATLDKSYTDVTKGSVTFTNYVVLQSTINQQIKALREKINGIRNGDTYFVWIRYADDDKGTNMSASPKDKNYVAIVTKKNQPIASDDPQDYVGNWALIKGANGINGSDGRNGDNAYFHIAYANSVDGKVDFTTEQNAQNRDYLGTYSDSSPAQSTDPTKYVWQLTRGAQGMPGQAGSKDVPVVTVSSNEPINPKDGDMWYQQITDADGTRIEGFFVRVNGQWQPSTIDQSVLTLTKLVSIEIDSATINSPNIVIPFTYIDGLSRQFDGTFEIKDGQITSISTMTVEGQSNKPMMKTTIGPGGYDASKYEDSDAYTKDNKLSHVTFDDSGMAMQMQGVTKTAEANYTIYGISGNNSLISDGNKIASIQFGEMLKYVSNETINKNFVDSDGVKTYTWFDLMSGIMSHPNLLKNASLNDGLTNWHSDNSVLYYTSFGHDGNNAVAINNGNKYDDCWQRLAVNPYAGNLVSLSYWFIRYDNTNFNNTGMAISFEKSNGSVIKRQNCLINNSAPVNKWTYITFDPIEVPAGTQRVSIMFTTGNGKGHLAISQPMVNLGDKVWPYQPT